MIEAIERSLSGIFCDDIREELHGKKSLIGCYSAIMEVSSFPITLPKLCIHAIVQTPATKPFKVVKLVVLQDDDVLAEGELPIPEQAPAIEPNQLSRLDVQFVFTPLTLEKPCTLRVRAHLDGVETRGLALLVKHRQADSGSSNDTEGAVAD